MSIISASVVTVPAVLPTGIVFAGINVTLTDGASFSQTNTLDLTSNTVTFTNVNPGTYTATAVAVDTTGANIGDPTPVSNSIVVSALTFPGPQTVTLTLVTG